MAEGFWRMARMDGGALKNTFATAGDARAVTVFELSAGTECHAK